MTAVNQFDSYRTNSITIHGILVDVEDVVLWSDGYGSEIRTGTLYTRALNKHTPPIRAAYTVRLISDYIARGDTRTAMRGREGYKLSEEHAEIKYENKL